MAKVSKNSRTGQRAAGGSGRDHIKVIKSVKDPVTGKYTYKEQILHKDKVKEFFAESK